MSKYFLVDEQIKSISEQISNRFSSIKSTVDSYRSSGQVKISKCSKIPLDFSVCATDGGLLSSRMHGFDIVLYRSVAVNFVYRNSVLTSFSYLPQKYPQTEFAYQSSLDEHEALVFKSLLRLRSELSCAISAMEKFSPTVFLFDGSLLPLPNDKVGSESKLYSLYQEVIALYEQLFTVSKEKSCLLVGVIKDSRSNRLSKSLSLDCSDTVLCNFLLNFGERTEDFPYSESESKTAVNGSQLVRFFYLKAAKDDLPLRIEYLSSEKFDVEMVASILYSLSAISDTFGYPAILVEADMCAALDGSEMDQIINSLRSINVSDLRRNSRPFR